MSFVQKFTVINTIVLLFELFITINQGFCEKAFLKWLKSKTMSTVYSYHPQKLSVEKEALHYLIPFILRRRQV